MKPGLRGGYALLALAMVVLGALVLHAMGRPLWCACGSLVPWSWEMASRHGSQHWIDPYSFTHLEHGPVYYALLRALLGPGRPELRALGALLLEVGWEVGENTDAVIRAYRESTIAHDYFGDSIANSLGDIAAFALGYAACLRLRAPAVLLGLLAIETALVLWIRDSLLLNVLMLLCPIAAVKQWQLGG
jgi:hypothetical protein